jgi:hypothetical protein
MFCTTAVSAAGVDPTFTARYPIDFAYTRRELEALLRHAKDHDVDIGAELVRLIAAELQTGEVVWGRTRQRQ